MSTEKEQTTMSTIHPIHPTLQFEAKHAMRFLDNLLQLFCPVMKRNIGILFLGGRGHLGAASSPLEFSRHCADRHRP